MLIESASKKKKKNLYNLIVWKGRIWTWMFPWKTASANWVIEFLTITIIYKHIMNKHRAGLRYPYIWLPQSSAGSIPFIYGELGRLYVPNLWCIFEERRCWDICTNDTKVLVNFIRSRIKCSLTPISLHILM